MKREIITIGENGKVHIPTTPVSPHAQLFRKWAIRKLTQKKSTTPLLVCYNKDGWYS